MKCRMIVAALGLACCAGGASAQSLQPQFYMWDSPPTNDPWTDPQMLPLLLSNAGLPTTDPVEIAEAFADEIQVVFATTELLFDIHFDLVQLYWADDETINCDTDSLQGADANYNGEVSTHDLTKFTADYLYARPAADFDNNGTVNATDMAAFLARYGQ